MKNLIFLIFLLLFSSCTKEKLFLADNQVIDMDENVYHSIVIGSQVWLKENLKTTRYSDNTLIPNLKENVDWTQTSSPAYCWYFNVVDKTSSKGALYNWSAVNTNKLCPTGWHIPSDAEWEELELYIGMDPVELDLRNWRGGELSERLKSNYDWSNPGTNDYDFTAVPSGFRFYSGGHFEAYDQQTNWWCKEEDDSFSAFFRSIVDYQNGIYRNSCPKNNGMSVRCIKNQ